VYQCRRKPPFVYQYVGGNLHVCQYRRKPTLGKQCNLHDLMASCCSQYKKSLPMHCMEHSIRIIEKPIRKIISRGLCAITAVYSPTNLLLKISIVYLTQSIIHEHHIKIPNFIHWGIENHWPTC
jgi:hypothetical protein